MHQSNQPKARRRLGRALAIAGGLLSVTALSQPNLAFAGAHGGGFHGGGFGGFHGGGMGGFHGGFAGMRGGGFGGFHGDRFRDAGSTAIGFATTGFSSVDRSDIPIGIIIRTTAIMAMTSPTILKAGIIAPILPAITLMWGSAIPAGRQFQLIDVCATRTVALSRHSREAWYTLPKC
jgi:hypothetical protein